MKKFSNKKFINESNKNYDIVYVTFLDSGRKKSMLGVTYTIEKAIEMWGLDINFITNQWGSMDNYVRWIKDKHKIKMDNGKILYNAVCDSNKIKDYAVDGYTFINIHEEKIPWY